MASNDPLKRLTIGELDAISQKIGADVMSAIAEGTALRWRALAHVAQMIARRDDPRAQVSTYLDMTPDELGDLLYPDTGDEQDDDERTDEEAIAADPTGPAPAP